MRPPFTPVLAAALAVARAAGAQGAPLDDLSRAVASAVTPQLRQTAGRAFASDDRVAVAVTTTLPEGARTALTTSLRGALGDVTVVDAGDGDVAAARAARASRLLRVAAGVEGAALRATARVVVVDHGPWVDFLRASPTAPTEGDASEARVALDVAGRRALGVETAARWPAVDPHPRAVPTPFHDVVALGLVDLDGDRRAELIIVGPRAVWVARYTDRGLVFLTSGAGTSLAALGWNPAPTRQPSGAVGLASDGRALLRTSATLRAGALRLSGDALEVTDAGDAAVPEPAPSGWSMRCAPSGGCALTPPGRAPLRLANTAAPYAVADIDGDGRVDVVSASASQPDAADRVMVATVDGERAVAARGFATPGPIEGVAVGDLDGDGLSDLVVCARDPARRASTLWIVP
ncbi:MAG: VCBS repeat-containing protein [Polyangiales bacterium]